MNNPIEKILEWRLDQLFHKLDFDIKNIALTITVDERNKQWKILNQKLVLNGYISLEKSTSYGCYYVIKNIVWKNIINCVIINDMFHVHMLWNKSWQNCGKLVMFPYFNRNLIFNKGTPYDHDSKNNLDTLYSIIINYLLLINPIILNHLISDLSNILKKYMFDVMLII